MERRTFIKSLGFAGAALIIPEKLMGVALAHSSDAVEEIESMNLVDQFKPAYKEKEVFKNDDVVIRQIDENTWEGNGHLMANESIYLIKGSKSAILLDAGTHIPGLKKIVEDIAQMPVTLIATHLHPDHTGDAINDWAEIWINAADEVSSHIFMKDYPGKKLYLTDGQIFDLGGRQIEVIFTPGHTPGSCAFLDKDKKYGFSGDSFGSGNLLITTNLTTQITTCEKMSYFLEKYDIKYMYPGHYMGSNVETPKRVSDIGELCLQLRAGEVKGEAQQGGMLKNVYSSRGVRLNYNDDGIR